MMDANDGHEMFGAPAVWGTSASSKPEAKDVFTGPDEEDEDDDDVGVASGTEHTGRWSTEEHDLFLKGLELYGKGWKKIAQLIKTRTVVQIRTHAQKYFQKLTKAKADPADPAAANKGDGKAQGGAGGRSSKSRKRPAAGGRRDRVVFQPAGSGGVAVAPSLLPYLALPGVGGSVEVGLYRFLSPALIDGKAPTELQSELAAAQAKQAKQEAHEVEESGGGSPAPAIVEGHAGEVSGSQCSVQGAGGPQLAPSSSKRAPGAVSALPVRLPEWYAHGAGMQALLAQAETIDWTADTGGDAIPLNGKVAKSPKRVPPKDPLAFGGKRSKAKEAKRAQSKRARQEAKEKELECEGGGMTLPWSQMVSENNNNKNHSLLPQPCRCTSESARAP